MVGNRPINSRCSTVRPMAGNTKMITRRQSDTTSPHAEHLVMTELTLRAKNEGSTCSCLLRQKFLYRSNKLAGERFRTGIPTFFCKMMPISIDLRLLEQGSISHLQLHRSRDAGNKSRWSCVFAASGRDLPRSVTF